MRLLIRVIAIKVRGRDEAIMQVPWTIITQFPRRQISFLLVEDFKLYHDLFISDFFWSRALPDLIPPVYDVIKVST